MHRLTAYATGYTQDAQANSLCYGLHAIWSFQGFRVRFGSVANRTYRAWVRGRFSSKIDTYGSVRKPHHRCQFNDFWQRFSNCGYKHTALTGLGFSLENAAINIMKKSAETPKQKPQANKPYGTKKGCESSRFSRRIRFGCKPNLPGLGLKIWPKMDDSTSSLQGYLVLSFLGVFR